MDKHEGPNQPNPSPRTDPAPAAYISPRLREKLSGVRQVDEDDSLLVKPGFPIGAILFVAMIVVICAGGLWVMSLRPDQEKIEAAREKVMADSVHVADSLAAAQMARDTVGAGLRNALAADSIAKATAVAEKAAARAAAQAAAAAAPTPSGASTAPAAPAVPATYAIAVGTYINQDRANVERDRFAAATHLEGSVDVVQEDGVDSYRVLLGSFKSSKEAQAKAGQISGAGQVNEARVVKVKGTKQP